MPLGLLDSGRIFFLRLSWLFGAQESPGVVFFFAFNLIFRLRCRCFSTLAAAELGTGAAPTAQDALDLFAKVPEVANLLAAEKLLAEVLLLLQFFVRVFELIV